jgi:thymidylate synthase (FAD)
MDDDIRVTVVEPSGVIITPLDWLKEYPRMIERAARNCYQSGGKTTEHSAEPFLRNRLMKPEHLSPLEHCVVTASIVCSRVCSHQLVRHRIAAYSQESQRYCDYRRLGLQIIVPPEIIAEGGLEEFKFAAEEAYRNYLKFRERRISSQSARYILPNCTKTEMVATFDLREWRHLFDVRALNRDAEWEIKSIFRELLRDLGGLLPVFFQDQLEQLKLMEEAEEAC